MLPTHDMNVIDLTPLISASTTVLGEGVSAKVLAVDAPEYPSSCIKVFKDDVETNVTLKEAMALHSLRHVQGIPRLLAYCQQPASFLMTRHGSCTLSDVIEKKADVKLTKALLGEILRQLSVILKNIHLAGFVHSDLKPDQLALDVEGGAVTVTLLDLGLATAVGSCCFADN